MGELLRERLSYPPGSTSRFVFGSVASGAEKAYSDIDLMVVGRTNLRQLANLISGLNVELGREVNPHLLRHEEFIVRKKRGRSFPEQCARQSETVHNR